MLKFSSSNRSALFEVSSGKFRLSMKVPQGTKLNRWQEDLPFAGFKEVWREVKNGLEAVQLLAAIWQIEPEMVQILPETGNTFKLTHLAYMYAGEYVWLGSKGVGTVWFATQPKLEALPGMRVVPNQAEILWPDDDVHRAAAERLAETRIIDEWEEAPDGKIELQLFFEYVNAYQVEGDVDRYTGYTPKYTYLSTVEVRICPDFQITEAGCKKVLAEEEIKQAEVAAFQAKQELKANVDLWLKDTDVVVHIGKDGLPNDVLPNDYEFHGVFPGTQSSTWIYLVPKLKGKTLEIRVPEAVFGMVVGNRWQRIREFRRGKFMSYKRKGATKLTLVKVSDDNRVLGIHLVNPD